MKNIRLSMKIVGNFLRLKKKKNFITFFEDYLNNYDKKDKRVMKQAYDKYVLFCSLEGNRNLTPDSETIRRFTSFLQSSSSGTGAASTYGRFRKVVIQATRHGIFKKNPCEGIKCFTSGDSLIKDILSEEDIRKLTETHYPDENHEIRKAFIFCLYTGIRFCDIKNLKYSNIDFTNRLIRFEQSKTKGSSSRCMAYIPLRDDLIQSILFREYDRNEHIFNLPSHPTCLKHLKKWTEASGIFKHITWHCARHSFATNILKNGADIKVVADLLGHSGLKYVEKYTRALSKTKINAVNSLPPIG